AVPPATILSNGSSYRASVARAPTSAFRRGAAVPCWLREWRGPTLGLARAGSGLAHASTGRGRRGCRHYRQCARPLRRSCWVRRQGARTAGPCRGHSFLRSLAFPLPGGPFVLLQLAGLILGERLQGHAQGAGELLDRAPGWFG